MRDVIRAHGLSFARFREPTVAFRTQYEAHYRDVGETPPPGAKTNAETTGKAMKWWSSLPAEAQAEWQRRMGNRR
jgi:hypothetical protein